VVLALLLLFALLGGCGTTERISPDTADPGFFLVWPDPPEPARIRYVRSISAPRDLGIRKSFFRKVWEFLLGEADERIWQPYGVQADPEGRLFVADPARALVHVFDFAEAGYRQIPDGQQDVLKYPVGVAVAAGQLFISDAEKRQIIVFDPRNGRILRTIGDPQELARPAGLAYHPGTGLLYVADTHTHRVLGFRPDGTLQGRIGRRGNGPGEFNFPTNIAVTPDGRLLVSDSMNFRIQILEPDGRFVSAFGRHGNALGDLARPKGVAADSDGNIYVVEGLFDVVNIYDGTGRLLLTFGGAGNGPGRFWLASGIFIDANDRIYVADSFNGRVQLFHYLKVPPNAGSDQERRTAKTP
jgi:DNA-binding beta-propeller fold protein YncE